MLSNEEIMQRLTSALGITYRVDVSDYIKHALDAIVENDIKLAKCHLVVALGILNPGKVLYVPNDKVKE